MSSGQVSQWNIQDEMENLSASMTASYMVTACATLVVFEQFLTFPQEVEVIWGRKLTGATLLFILNRYIILLETLFVVLAFLVNWNSDLSCKFVQHLTNVLLCIQYLVVGAFSALRVYAVNASDWWSTSLVIILSIFPVIPNIYNDVKSEYGILPPPMGGCGGAIGIPVTTYVILLIATRACVVATDAVVIGVTWYRTYGIKVAAKKANIKATLTTLILRDGTIYFLVLLVLNILDVAFVLSATLPSLGGLIAPITSVLISRFILNLRQVDLADVGHISGMSAVSLPGQNQSVELRFATNTFVGNMGAPLGNDSYLTTGMDATSDDDGPSALMVAPETVGGYAPVHRDSGDEES